MYELEHEFSRYLNRDGKKKQTHLPSYFPSKQPFNLHSADSEPSNYDAINVMALGAYCIFFTLSYRVAINVDRTGCHDSIPCSFNTLYSHTVVCRE